MFDLLFILNFGVFLVIVVKNVTTVVITTSMATFKCEALILFVSVVVCVCVFVLLLFVLR